jgi:hypothetical protein
VRPTRRSRAALVALLALSATSAAAQRAPDGAAHDEARARFEHGVAFIQAERWADAITELQRAREIRTTPAVLYNLGLAYRAVGRNRDATATFAEFLRGATAATSPELVARARAYQREAAAGVARLDLQVEPPTARVIVDGTLSLTRLGITLDPGRHVVVAEAPGYTAEARSVDLLRGARQSLALRLAPVASAAVAPAAPLHPAPSLLAPTEPREERSGVLRSPWFWVAVGVVAVGAGVVTYLALREETAPVQGTFGTVTDALTLGRWR